MKLIVEISQGLGNCVQGTAMCHALWLMGHELDLYINAPLGPKLAELWQGWPVVGRIFTHHDQIIAGDYDFGVSGYGRRQLTRMFPPGLCLKVEKRHVRAQSESEAGVELARWLGYAGPTPACYLGNAAEVSLPPRSVTIHAGCDPANRAKQWPHWQPLATRLQDASWHVIVVGTDTDRAGWEDGFDARFNLPLAELCGVLRRSVAHFGNDSGVGHLASAAGAPGLMLYGPSNPIKNRPNSSVMRMLVADALGTESRETVPIERITLEQAWSAALALLEGDLSRDPPRDLPQRLQDGVDLRWQHYVNMTLAQPAAEVPASEAVAGAPRVSVVIPTFNRADNVQRAVASALAQTESDLEVIVVDDGSTDDTAARFNDLPPRVRYIRQPNGGASRARNTGLRAARGELIALLDSDDEWLPEKLALQLAAMGDKYVASACRHVHVNADGSRQDKPELLPGRDNHLFRDLYNNLSLKTSSLVFRRHLLDKIGLFNERFPISNDWDFFLRLARAVNNSGMTICEQSLLVVHRSGDSISKSRRANALEEAYTRICIVNALLHSEDPHATRRHTRRAAAKHLELSRAYRKQHDLEQAKHHAREAIRGGEIMTGLWRRLQAFGP